MAAFHPPLDALVEAYRRLPFQYWSTQFETRQEIHDSAEGDPASPNWWQADTAVLEIGTDAAGRRYAQVAIWLSPLGVTSSPPAPSAAFLVYESGEVVGTWANGATFRLSSGQASAMATDASLERKPDRQGAKPTGRRARRSAAPLSSIGARTHMRVMNDEDQAALLRLQWATQALAAEPEAQLGLFPVFVDKPFELVDEFDNWFRATVWRTSLAMAPAQVAALNELSDAIGALATSELSEDAVRVSATWERLRSLARDTLSCFGWPSELPPQDRAAYVPAARS
jgi:hypothetical protein